MAHGRGAADACLRLRLAPSCQAAPQTRRPCQSRAPRARAALLPPPPHDRCRPRSTVLPLTMAPGSMLTFNVDDGYLEAILRGYRSVRWWVWRCFGFVFFSSHCCWGTRGGGGGKYGPRTLAAGGPCRAPRLLPVVGGGLLARL